MSVADHAPTTAVDKEIQIVTFTVHDILLGVDIAYVQEINRHLDVTPVPEASEMIHGVVNLRGDVLTVLNPHQVFAVPPCQNHKHQRNLVLNVDGERIGILVDNVADILTISTDELSRRPSNVRAIDRQFIDSVYLHGDEIIVLLNATQLLAAID
ncbi:chemotaxis protein CheW [Stieleria varia]|uniref:Chemotaxis protein CheW n=1 Tax=Stieleria varia TaxID=2528005 RepID=A0A5C6B4A3_9BACT|nr:chemotaxis protein CheW [Stieleria varia]TWU06311.1 Chemotaxis protein CheW [Stieleria varia]